MALLQRVSSLAPTLRSLSAQRPAFYFLVDRSVHFKDREQGEELVHFRKEDEKLLRKLLEKVRAQADKVSVLLSTFCVPIFKLSAHAWPCEKI